MTLSLVVPMWATEHTVTIHRGEGLYQDGTGVYYCVKDGIMMTFTDGLDNENYLVERRAKTFEVRSANYIIKKVVFHCVDNTTQDNLDCFYWGPTTISTYSNFTYPGQLGNYYVTNNGYDGVWEGQTMAFMFTTADGKPVRFGSVDIIYDKLEGDIFELVTHRSQIYGDDNYYVIVSQYHDKVMSFKKTDDASFPSAPIAQWMNAAKTKVKVDGSACIVKLLGAKDSTYNNNTRRVARLSTLNNGYIRSGSGNDQGNLLITTTVNDYSRGLMYCGTDYNFLCWFKGDNYSNASNTIRYDDSDGSFKIMSTSNSDTRVWLYKLAQSYNVYTECDPTNGGYITINDGVWEGMSQEGETVQFRVNTNWGYRIKRVVVINLATNDTTVLSPDEVAADGANYHFDMPAANVKIRAEFYESEPDLYLLGTAMGRTGWVASGPKFDFDPVNEEYYLEVYFKGDVNTQDTFGHFSLTKRIDPDITWQTAPNNSGNWGLMNGQRLAAQWNNYDVQNGSTNVPLYSNNPDNAFRIPAGVYLIKVNKAMTLMSIEEIPLTLTFTPPSGQVEPETTVTITSDLQTVVHRIAQRYNINEDAAQFKNSLNGGNTWDYDNTALITEVGQTTVTAEAWIGYIIVPGTAVYTIPETPLNVIEDEIDPDTKVIVSDELIGAWAVDYYSYEKQKRYKLLWARDEVLSINPTYPATGQGDYVMFAQFQKTPWLQNNWVVLDFSNFPEYEVEALVNTKIKAGTVMGLYNDDENYTIKLSSLPTPNGEATGYYGYCEDNNELKHNDYKYNHYMAMNFLQSNLNLDGNTGAHPGPASVVQDTALFFMNPKIQEVAHVMGVWMGQGYNGQDVFTVYTRKGNVINGFDLSGSFYVDWTYNRLTNSDKIYGKPGDLRDTAYTFHAGIARSLFDPGETSTPSGLKNPKPAAPDGSFMVYPFDLPNSPVPTSVQNFVALKRIESVRYYNVMGMASDTPFEGVNIVVTRYSDGSYSTMKVIR